MTLTLELPAEIESRLEAEARTRGVAPAIVAGEVLGAWAHDKAAKGATNGNGQKPLSARQQAALDGYGKYAGRSRTSDDLIRERREEATLEMAQAARRDVGDFAGDFS